MKHIKKNLVKQLKKRGFYQELLQEKQDLAKTKRELEKVVRANKHLLEYDWFARPGHFYSPLVTGNYGDFKHLVDLWKPKLKVTELPGIKLNKKAQFDLLAKLAKHRTELQQFTDHQDRRYQFGNDQFGPSDTTILFLMLRQLQAKRITEVGSGWSSALMLDTNELFPKQAAELTFIDPHPERLLGTLKKGDKKHCKIITKQAQEISPTQLAKLGSGDVLFIDNSHVSKSGSDVNHLFFEVLPRLKKGVVVHIHDIFYPFEYPLQWVVEDKRNWNEIYVLRALLTHSEEFEIMLWPSYLLAEDKSQFKKLVPTATDLGGSIWLRKIR